MKLRQLAYAVVLSLALSLPCCVIVTPAHAELSKTLHAEKAGGFSYYPPKGWELTKKKPSPYAITIAPLKPGMKFRPNMNFNVVAAPVSLDAFVDANLEYVIKNMGAKLVSKTPFKTKSGSSGYRIVTTAKRMGMNLRQVFYFLTTSSANKVLVTATSLASEGAKSDPLFDDTARSITTK